MATHDYDIQIAGDNLQSVYGIRRAIFMNYSSATKRDGNLVLPHKHGELFVPDKYFAGADVLLQIYLPFDAVDEGKQALSDMALLLSAQDEVLVSQNDPAHGNIQARVENLQDPIPTEDRFTYLFSLRNASGFWEDVSVSQEVGNPPSITTLGDRPIDDMILTYSGPGFLEHTDPIGQVSRVTIDAAAGAGTYIVDVGAGTVQKASVDQDAYLTVDQEWWMKFQPGLVQPLTSDVPITVDWRNKHA